MTATALENRSGADEPGRRRMRRHVRTPHGDPLIRHDAHLAGEPAAERPGPAPVDPLAARRGTTTPTLLRQLEGSAELAATAETDGDRRRPTQLAGLREERRQIVAISRIVCQATMESLSGARPVKQMQHWLEACVYQKVCERAELMARRRTDGPDEQAPAPTPRPLEIRQVRADHVEGGIWEASVIFTEDARTRACAMRVEAHRGRWRVVALEMG